MAKKITEYQLTQIKWYDFSIVNVDEKVIFIFLCEEARTAKKLKVFLTTNNFNLTLFKKEDGSFTVVLDFIKTDFVMEKPTKRNLTNFPNLNHILEQTVTHITTGIKEEDSGMMQWDDNYYPISYPS